MVVASKLKWTVERNICFKAENWHLLYSGISPYALGDLRS